MPNDVRALLPLKRVYVPEVELAGNPAYVFKQLVKVI